VVFLNSAKTICWLFSCARYAVAFLNGREAFGKDFIGLGKIMLFTGMEIGRSYFMV